MSVKLSKYWDIGELTASDYAIRNGINNNPTKPDIENLTRLAVHVLDPIVDLFGESAVHVSSGFRSKDLNVAIGGSRNSQHMVGEAVDFTVKGFHPDYVVKKIMESGIEYDQIIEEFGRWVHISYRKGNNRKQALRAYKHNNQTAYLPL